MVDRYCRLVCDDGVSPDASSPSPSPTRPRPSCASGSAPSWRARRGAARATRRELLGALGGAWVTTIHGFCNRLLAAHPVAAGIDPRFRVLDAPEAERAAREAFDEALEEFLADDDGPPSGRDRRRLRRRRPAGDRRRRPRGAAQPRRGRARLPEPPPTTPARPSRDAEAGAAAAAAEELTPNDRPRAGAGRARPATRPGRRLDDLLRQRCDTDSKAKAIAAYREAIERGDRRRRRGAARAASAYRHSAELLELFGRRFEAAKAAARRARLRGPAARRGALLERTGADRRGLPRPLPPPARRRVPGHQRLQLRLIEALRGPDTRAVRRRRRAAVDLRLPPRRPRRLPRAARR